MSNSITLRSARPEDARAILDIYRPYVAGSVVTFEYEVPALEEFRGRIEEISSDFPFIVAEIDGCIAGYAYAHKFRERAAYNWTVETSIYVSVSMRRQGIGRLMYTELERLLALQNVVTAVACVSLPNPVSISFHESLGYRTVGHIEKSAYKLGQWCDILFMEKILDTSGDPPKPLLPPQRLP